MIVRLWHGWTRPADADAYERLLRTEIVGGILARALPGFRGIEVLRREGGDEVAFVTLLRFDDWAAVEAFAGPDAERAVVPPEARRLLSRFDAHSTHYRSTGPEAP